MNLNSPYHTSIPPISPIFLTISACHMIHLQWSVVPSPFFSSNQSSRISVELRPIQFSSSFLHNLPRLSLQWICTSKLQIKLFFLLPLLYTIFPDSEWEFAAGCTNPTSCSRLFSYSCLNHNLSQNIILNFPLISQYCPHLHLFLSFNRQLPWPFQLLEYQML